MHATDARTFGPVRRVYVPPRQRRLTSPRRTSAARLGYLTGTLSAVVLLIVSAALAAVWLVGSAYARPEASSSTTALAAPDLSPSVYDVRAVAGGRGVLNENP